MEQNVDIVQYVSTLLDEEKYKEALSIPINEHYANSFMNNCWNLISVIISKIDNDTLTLKPSLYGACEEYLSIIVQTAAPEETLLEFLEQIEGCSNDAQFSIILEPLQELLLKLSAKRGRCLEWCFNSINTYIDKIPLPEYQLDGKERLILDCDDNMRRIMKVYSLLPPFYEPFLREALSPDAKNNSKQIVNDFLMALLVTLVYMDVDPHSNKTSETRKSHAIIINDICLLTKNALKWLELVEMCYIDKQKEKMDTEKKKKCDDDGMQPYFDKTKINITTLSEFFYSVLSGHFPIPDTAMPLVYSPDYVVTNVLYCVVHLLSFTEYCPVNKGLVLCKEILNYSPDNISSCKLNTMIHYSLTKCLMNIALYATYETARKEAVLLIKLQVNKFEYKGRCLLIKYILDNANHSGMIGYAITLFKNSLNEALNEPDLPACFMNVQLNTMVKKICYLPHGVETDLIELADQIITALNFLRYLVIRDYNNRTNIKSYFSEIESDYLEPLRTSLNLSKAHYEDKLRDIEACSKTVESHFKISINIGDNVLDKIPDTNKKEIVQSALNAFHLIECLVARLNECINLNKNS